MKYIFLFCYILFHLSCYKTSHNTIDTEGHVLQEMGKLASHHCLEYPCSLTMKEVSSFDWDSLHYMYGYIYPEKYNYDSIFEKLSLGIKSPISLNSNEYCKAYIFVKNDKCIYICIQKNFLSLFDEDCIFGQDMLLLDFEGKSQFWKKPYHTILPSDSIVISRKIYGIGNKNNPDTTYDYHADFIKK